MRTIYTLAIMAAVAFTANAATPTDFHVTSSRAHADRMKLPRLSSLGINPEKYGSTTLRKLTHTPDRMAKTPLPPGAPSSNWVTELPDGVETKIMTKEGVGFVYTWGGIIYEPTTGSYVEVAIDGTDVYLKNIWAFALSDGYIVGKIDGNKITFDLPQVVQIITNDIDESGETDLIDYALAAEMIEIENPEGNIKSFQALPDQTISFTVKDDGTWFNDNPDIFIGQFDYYPDEAEDDNPVYDWQWLGSGDYIDYLTPFDKVAPEVPDDITMTPWIRISDGYGYEAEIGFSADKCYLRGAIDAYGYDYNYIVITGDVEGNRVSFPSGQYLGLSDDIGYVLFFEAGKFSDDENSSWTREDAMVYEYDADKKILTPVDDKICGLLIPTEVFENIYCDLISPATFIAVNPNGKISGIKTPTDGVVYEEDELYPMQVCFTFSNLSDNNMLLDLDRLYYQVLADGDIIEFDPADYEELESPVKDIPILASYNPYMFANNNSVTCPIYVNGFDELSVRLLYKADSTSAPVYSDILTVFSTNAVNAPVGVSTVGRSYFDIHGRRLAGPAKGINIRADRMSDGSVKYVKELVR